MTSDDLRQIFVNRMAELNLTQKELAQKSGVHQSTISHILNYNSKLNLKTMFQLIDALEFDFKIVPRARIGEDAASQDST